MKNVGGEGDGTALRASIGEFIGKHVPLALVMALLIQGATAVWWVAARDRDGFFLERRVSHLEDSSSRLDSEQGQILERLARIEERVNSQLGILDRIEKQTSGRGRE